MHDCGLRLALSTEISLGSIHTPPTGLAGGTDPGDRTRQQLRAVLFPFPIRGKLNPAPQHVRRLGTPPFLSRCGRRRRRRALLYFSRHPSDRRSQVARAWEPDFLAIHELLKGGSISLQLRASNEALLRARVVRAKETNGPPPTPPTPGGIRGRTAR